MMWDVENEKLIVDCRRIFMKGFDLVVLDGSFILGECMVIFGVIVVVMMD